MASLPSVPRIFLNIFVALSIALLAACGGESLSDTSSPSGSVGLTDATVYLAWNPHPDQSVTGYLVYYGSALDSTTIVIDDLSVNSGLDMEAPSVQYKAWSDLGLHAGDDFCFRIKAYNSDGESGLSSGVCKRV